VNRNALLLQLPSHWRHSKQPNHAVRGSKSVIHPV